MLVDDMSDGNLLAWLSTVTDVNVLVNVLV